MSNYGFEVIFRAVGENSNSGDCIAIRYGDFSDRSKWFLILVDGGWSADGEAFVQEMWEKWGTKHIDLVIMTHPDADHANGLKAILNDESVSISALWMHTPWVRDLQLKKAMAAENAGSSRLSANARASLSAAEEVHTIAVERGIDVEEPFAGTTAGGDLFRISVLGPSAEFFDGLLEEMETSEAVSMSLNAMTKSAAATATLQKAGTQVSEDWWTETLEDPSAQDVKPRNNSSAILLIEATTTGVYSPVQHRVLLTADAGVQALERAIEFADSDLGVDLRSCDLQQVPHHGSQRNIGPTILDQLIGPKKPFDDGATKSIAVVSAAKENPDGKHPNGAVTNAYKRRGAAVHVTAGQTKIYQAGECPDRVTSYSQPVPFQTSVAGAGS
jgi:beta-lactamase superfamily II metal-dependent hydrolase